jgi:putative peptide maturation dehydrogenase
VPRICRTRYALFYLEDRLDPRALLRGELPDAPGGSDVLALALLTGQRHRLRRDQVELLLSLPAGQWVSAGDLPEAGVGELAELGLLISDLDEEPQASLRRRDEALAINQWNLYAAAYHLMTQWREMDIRGEMERLELGHETREATLAYMRNRDPPPGPFPESRSGPTTALPEGWRSGALYDALLARRTTRSFAPGTAMSADDLATVLRYVFGSHGEARNVADVALIKRTSPSGGAMHPIEAYPIVTNVRAVEPGIYHYDARRHVLEPLSPLDADEARPTVTRFLAGQDYFGDAHVSIVLTARFYRSHWKYRRHPKAYAGILMDAAHLSQTLYLVATELGLGAFVTVAINGLEIEERLGLDGIEEGVIAVCGCGVRAAGDSPLELSFSGAPRT